MRTSIPFLRALFVCIFAAGSVAAQFDDGKPGSTDPGFCIGERFCDSTGCRPTTDPMSQMACGCSPPLLDPACGYPSCSSIGSLVEGAACSFPVAYLPGHVVSQVLCAGAGLNSSCNTDCTPPPPNMEAWWTLDRLPWSPLLAPDQIGPFWHHGILNNGAVHGAGKVDQAVYFDGVDDFIQAPIYPNTTDHPYYNLSVDAWVRPDSLNPGQFQTLVEWKGQNPGSYALFLYGDEIGFAIQGNPSSYTPITTNANLQIGEWVHLTAVADPQAQEIRFYVDAVLVHTFGSYVTQGWLAGNGNSWFLGENFKGALDEVEIFERVLGQSEIQALVDADAAGKCKPAIP